MNKTWMVHHLARCGSHAIINWMARCLHTSVQHYNNVNHELTPRNIEIYENGQYIKRIEKFMVYNGDCDLRICSTENFDLNGYKETFGGEPIDRTFFIIRDPRNWIASSLKTGGYLGDLENAYQGDTMKEFGYTKWFCESITRPGMYKQYLGEILGETNLTGRDVEVIDYDLWLESDPYRDSFDFGNSNVDTSEESPYCGGSSFGGGSPLQRWNEMEDEVNQYIDEEMKDLYEEYKQQR